MADIPSVPQSNTEQYLSAIAGLTDDVPSEPQSRVEAYLAYILENGGLGGNPSGIFKPGGTVSELPELTEENLGLVFGVDTNFTTTSSFIEGAGHFYTAGTNITVVTRNGDYFYDVFSGPIDLTGKVDKETGKGLSTNDYTDADKAKLDGISDSAADLDNYSFPVTVSGDIVTFSAAAAGRPVDTVVHIEPVQSGSGDPSPSNVRPITGWTGAKVTRTGKNLLNWGEAVIGGINSATGAETAPTSCVRSGYIPALPGLTYVVSRETGQDITLYFVVFYNENRERISDTSTASVFTVPNSARWMRLVFRKSNYSDDFTAGELSGFHVQLEIGDTATSFQAFGSAYTISFGSAETVYGGTLDVARGELVVDRASRIFDGSNDEIWTAIEANKRYYTAVADISKMQIDKEAGPISSNMYLPVSYSGGLRGSHGITMRDGAAQINIFLDEWMPMSDWRQFLSEHNLQVVYPLDSPLTYQFAPQQLTTLLGTNTVWADCGTVDVTHWPGTGTPMAPRDAAGPTAAQFWALAQRVAALES